MATYKGNIIAMLAVDDTSPPFNSLEELLEMPEYDIGILGGTAWDNLFKVRTHQLEYHNTTSGVDFKIWLAFSIIWKFDLKI